MTISLFKLGNFISHSGLQLDWKIECDSLTPDDWECFAHITSQLCPDFKQAYGVPNGGTPYANALQKYINPDSDLILIVDDVYTTGNSLREYHLKLIEDGIINTDTNIQFCVAFSRTNEIPSNILAIWKFGSYIGEYKNT